MRILIAEDDRTSRAILSAVLKKCGYAVAETTDGAQAWKTMRSAGAPRMAILDWMMPGLDGLDVVRRIRSRPTDRPPYLIMLTTKSDKRDIVDGLDAGADDYLAKPFDTEELRARVAVGRRIVEMQDQLAQQVEALRKALEHIKTLQGILPICSFCKKIRDDQGYWDQVESYLFKHSEVQFSHGICPACMQEHYAEYCDEDDDDSNDPVK